MHMVTYDSQYPTMGAAANKDGGLAVLGFFFEVSRTFAWYAPVIAEYYIIFVGLYCIACYVTLHDIRLRTVFDIV